MDARRLSPVLLCEKNVYFDDDGLDLIFFFRFTYSTIGLIVIASASSGERLSFDDDLHPPRASP